MPVVSRRRHPLIGLAVSGSWAGFAARNHATFLIASDPDRSDTGAAYPIYNFPTHILIDEDGIVREVLIAARSQDGIVAHAQKILPDGGGWPAPGTRSATQVVGLTARRTTATSGKRPPCA